LAPTATLRLSYGLLALFIGWACTAQALYEPPANYYTNANGKAGAALKSALHARIAPHTIRSYDDARTILQVLDVDPGNAANIVLVYSGFAVTKTWDSGVTWNREHLWPQSRGVSTGPGESDLFNLRPSNPVVNSTRGNKLFDNSNPGDAGYKSPAAALAPLCSSDSDSWQPRPAEQGDIARALFYMDTRYDGTEPNTVDLELTNVIVTGSQMGIFSTLVLWHLADPVDELERRRNDLIYSNYQANRNPYVDHPEYVQMVYGVPEPALLMLVAVLGLLCRRPTPRRGLRLRRAQG
jgi:endonuclease I